MQARILKALCLLCLFAAAGWTQSFLGSLTGTILDSSGAAVPQAKVTATEIATGVHHDTVTNGSGNYSFPDLTPGTYALAVSAPGFKDAKSGGMVLTAQQAQRLDVRLELGSSSQTIEIAAQAPTINTENAEVTGLQSHRELENAPVNYRSTISFFFLNSFNTQGEGSSYSLGGLRGQNTNFTIDGVTSNASLFGGQSGPQTEESFESIREMKLMASNNSAEFPNVATVLIESRSGENALHGSAFFLTENNALNARNFFSNSPNPPGPIRHQFGASFGGPVVLPKLYNGRNKSFFFFSWEQEKFPGGYTGTANVPTSAFQQGNFSSLLSGPNPIQLKNPYTGGAFDGNIIPSNLLNPVSLGLQKFGFLPPNAGAPDSYTANWVGFFPTADYDNRYVTRLDHTFSEHDSLSGRLSIRAVPEPAQYDADLPIFFHNQYRRTFNTYISETHIFTPTLLNEFRIGFSRDRSTLSGAHSGSQVVKSVGLQGIDTTSTLTGVPYVGFQDISSMNEFYTYFYMSETSELLDNVTFVKGRHTMKAGVLVRHNTPSQSNQPNGNSDFGAFNFDGFATGFDYADFLLGLPHTTSLAYRAPNSYFVYNNTGLFLQDEFHATPKLTLNFGLRWEYNQPPIDRNDLRYSFNPANGDIVVPTQKVLGLASPFFPSNIPIQTSAQAGYPGRSLVQSNWRDLAPRFSFAYRPLGADNFVVRGGYGIFYSPLVGTLLGNFEGGPFASNVGYTNQITNGQPSFAFPFAFGSDGSIPSQTISPVNPHLRTPYVQQWNLSIERELPGKVVAHAGYRGFMSLELPYTRDLNMPPPSADPANQNVFYYPNYYQAYWTEDGGIQKMHALDVSLERKLSGGLIFQSQYTFAKNLSDAGNDGEANLVMNPYNRSQDMGNVSFQPRHRWVTSTVYELPFGSGQRWGSNLNRVLRPIVGGWQATGVFVWQTGQFLTPTFSGADITNNRSTNIGLNRPDCLADPNLSNPSRANWFDQSAFALPSAGTYGNCGRGIIVGPGVTNLDLGLMKNFKIRERGNLQIRATATNALNHPLWRNPSAEVISSTNGNVITNVLGTTTNRASVGAGYRIIEVGARIDF